MIREHFDLVIVGLIALSVAMYDMVIDLFLNVLHLCFELLHILYEWFELGIEHSVEHLFHTSRHGSQIVTFYILLLIAGLLLYGLWRVMPRLCRRCVQFLVLTWERRKTECHYYWLSLPLVNKVKLLSTATGVFSLTFYFMT
ncbi:MULTISPECIES: hypothetical protein [Methylomonas]|uniref:Uncharacterized protein n=2 Tax=Methylomonas TaxID=416 RepID=A0A126T727_9GAMM|nr:MULTISPECIES: hypothetical protein [Methylomonas]AMK77889.1 hypothetical protein JT25_015625 [Methylomonas denitrificans]OAI04549.1 hypothetical protein A1342_13820 [Methylomonas methanica]TCV87062.1 hypothetical protein EDE11_103291 [Methylomonas methanica]